MSTWTNRQVAQVRSMYVSVWLDDAQPPSVKEAALGYLTRVFVAEARTFGVEVHPLDLAFRESRDEGRCQVEVVTRWAPLTREAELVGGPRDGEALQVRDVEEPLVLSIADRLPWWSDSETQPEPEFRRIVYRRAGWRERERRWVLAPDGVLHSLPRDAR